ncbi:hypothetical protein [Clostridium sp. HBUAS56010]|uniref:hypothetical protein n=1 Tax=Clostridium sp. HBUAS56010 TaxID=2571127 RepID=UPI0011782381|nr:hypothetical protein [Clostridium sp. HBUAS56010]
MKFITEDDLRILFKKEPFTVYDLSEGVRLTPGARQFLVDKKIAFQDGLVAVKRKNPGTELKKEEIDKKEPDKKETQSDLFLWKRKTLQAQFLEAGLVFMKRDVLLAEQVFDLERRLSFVGKESSGQESLFQDCTGFDKENLHEPFEDCFEITGFHAQSEKGAEIVLLHRLRCCTRELAAETGDKRFYPVINRLSQMICMEYGGKTCQKRK